MLPLLGSALAGYLLGSIPAAYLMVRWKSRMDIRREGSGNVGTLNSFLVTKSKAVGVAVLLADLLKGLAAVFLAPLIAPEDPFLARAVAGTAAVAGHNFPVWLGGKGGRGLATAAGVMLPLQAGAVLAWALGWVATFLPLRKVNLANALATAFIILIAVLLPADLIEKVMPAGATATGFRMMVIVLMGIVLIRHIGPLREYARERAAAKGGPKQ